MKLEVGKQYRTRGGWRAFVVVDIQSTQVICWHTNGGGGQYHNPDGSMRENPFARETFGDLIEEYKEPKTKEVYVHWLDNPYDYHVDTTRGKNSHCIAIKKVTLTEGEFDD